MTGLSFGTKGVWVLGLLMILAACAGAPEGPEARIDRLGHELRCPVCRGVPIAESPAELAQQMMTVVRQQVAAGKSDEEILRYFEERYGEWALLAPKAEGANLIIWIFPPVFLVGGGLWIVRRLKKRGV